MSEETDGTLLGDGENREALTKQPNPREENNPREE